MSKLEALQKKYSDLLADMKKLDRDHTKSKKRADQLQKERDQGRSELSKTTTMKDKLEKLCRELTRENKKVKVRMCHKERPYFAPDIDVRTTVFRTNTKSLRTRKRRIVKA
jgi:hypothetical protein